ncbi:MAG: glycoside hydrolase family 2 [Clostridia bacterium]|nr:glycoside hydrolase family 2 [Clostridia bacterium]
MENNFNILTTDFKMEDIPHNYYPRPQLKRDSFILLNGEWDFAEKDYDIKGNYDEKIIVPFPMESMLSKVNRIHDKKKTMFYKKEFELFVDNENPITILHFGAVDCVSNVFVNGEYVGSNNGGYLPFQFDITNFVENGKNVLEVQVRDELTSVYPYGKQRYKRGGMWYTPTSGIWQSVWIEQVPRDYIKSIKIFPSLEKLILSVKGGKEEKTIIFNGKEYNFSGNDFELEVQNKELWTPENPKLYDFELKSGNDKVTSYFALRTIGIKKDKNNIERIMLNDKPYFFSGLLDQGYFPDGLFMPKSIEGFEFDIKNVKALGFNMIRKHIKIEPLIYYYLCDKIGICVFQDMVNNGKYNFINDTALPTLGKKKNNDKHKHRDKLTRQVFEIYMKNTAKHLFNHPCVVYYTIFNEGWGQFCSDKMYNELKTVDNTRIIDSTSGWFKNNLSDVESEHIYFKPIKLEKSNKPIVLSEFGGYAYKIPEHSFNLSKTYAYKFLNTQEEFMKELENLYINQVLPFVSQGLCATVYTQTSDIEDETNGIFTYDRKVIKVNKEKMLEINKKLIDEIYN